MTQDNKHNERISVPVKNKTILDILSRVAPIAGVLIGSLLYGGGLLLTGTVASLTGWLAYAGLGLVGGVVVSIAATSLQKKPSKEEKRLVEEEQIIVFDTPAKTLQENGDDLSNFIRVLAASQAYCACTKSKWQEIAHDMGLNLNEILNDVPDDPLTPIFAVFIIPAHTEEIQNTKSDIRTFLRGYSQRNSGEKAKLYKKPLLDKHMLEYGFKI